MEIPQLCTSYCFFGDLQYQCENNRFISGISIVLYLDVFYFCFFKEVGSPSFLEATIFAFETTKTPEFRCLLLVKERHPT